jgi:hypothetical protein
MINHYKETDDLLCKIVQTAVMGTVGIVLPVLVLYQLCTMDSSVRRDIERRNQEMDREGQLAYLASK